MNIRNRNQLRRTAGHALAAAPGNPRGVALVYGGIVCGFSLLSTVVSYILSNQITNTGGLDGIGMRSVLSTAQVVLAIAQILVTFALDLGYRAAMLDVIRGRRTEPRSLVTGFRRFGPMLRATVAQYMICAGAVLCASYISSFLFSFLPAYDAYAELVTPLMESYLEGGVIPTVDDATLSAIYQAMLPMMGIFLLTALALLIPVIYRYRMVTFCIADAEHPRALMALRDSQMMMRRNRIALFRLDLGFWWYYLLQGLVTVVCYGDVLLPMVGITFPWSSTVSYFLFYTLSVALQFAIYAVFMNRVTSTYAAAYEAIRPQPQKTGSGVVLGNIFDLAKEYREEN